VVVCPAAAMRKFVETANDCLCKLGQLIFATWEVFRSVEDTHRYAAAPFLRPGPCCSCFRWIVALILKVIYPLAIPPIGAIR
jgi:hypothetical protein